MKEIILKVTRGAYQECGECMFLDVSIFQVRKHRMTDGNYCRLFGENLVGEKHDDGVINVIPCNQCNELPDE